MDRKPRGLFVGLATLDLIQLVNRVPFANEKMKSVADSLAAGGPATNAAVGFSALGGAATLFTRAGAGVLWELLSADLTNCGVDVVRAPAPKGHTVSAASILVTESSGERAVVSTHDRLQPGAVTPDYSEAVEQLPIDDFDVVELDGHQADLADAVANRARAAGVTVILDGGSWKETTSKLLPLIDAAVVSADFSPSECRTAAQVLDFLLDQGVRFAAVTAGENPIRYRTYSGSGEIIPPKVRAVDTLGAGDFFHGALTHRLSGGLTEESFVAALKAGSELAAHSIQYFGTRAWLATYR